MTTINLLMFVAAISVTLSTTQGKDVAAKAFIKPDCKTRYPAKIYGMVNILQTVGKKATFRIKLMGLFPNTYHGFHVHQYGDVHSQGCLSTGGHYNPFNVTHGGPKDKIRHVGDLGNVYSDREGHVDITFTDRLAGIIGDYSVAGRAFVVHEKKDDLGRGTGEAEEGSKKTGNAGSRIGCGVIYITNPGAAKMAKN